MTATINANAAGRTRALIGQTVTVLGPGSNRHHVWVSDGGRPFALPVRWLDFEEDDDEGVSS